MGRSPLLPARSRFGMAGTHAIASQIKRRSESDQQPQSESGQQPLTPTGWLATLGHRHHNEPEPDDTVVRPVRVRSQSTHKTGLNQGIAVATNVRTQVSTSANKGLKPLVLR